MIVSISNSNASREAGKVYTQVNNSIEQIVKDGVLPDFLQDYNDSNDQSKVLIYNHAENKKMW